MLQSLIISRPEENLCDELPARVTGIHDLVASALIPVLRQQLADLLHVDGVVERRGVTNLALVGANLTLQALN